MKLGIECPFCRKTQTSGSVLYRMAKGVNFYYDMRSLECPECGKEFVIGDQDYHDTIMKICELERKEKHKEKEAEKNEKV